MLMPRLSARGTAVKSRSGWTTSRTAERTASITEVGRPGSASEPSAVAKLRSGGPAELSEALAEGSGSAGFTSLLRGWRELRRLGGQRPGHDDENATGYARPRRM